MTHALLCCLFTEYLSINSLDFALCISASWNANDSCMYVKVYAAQDPVCVRRNPVFPSSGVQKQKLNISRVLVTADAVASADAARKQLFLTLTLFGHPSLDVLLSGPSQSDSANGAWAI